MNNGTRREITDFHEIGYEFLSNFYVCDVEYDGIKYKNSEAAYQAQKVLDEEKRLAFADLDPKSAKVLGQSLELRPDCEEVKVEIMHSVVYAKFVQNLDLRQKLIDMGDAVLIEGNTWGDTFWGVDKESEEGENYLGRVLMTVREELRCLDAVIKGLKGRHEGKIRHLELQAEGGDELWQMILGEIYFFGIDTSDEYLNEIERMVALKKYYLRERKPRNLAVTCTCNREPDYEKALKWYRMAAKQGNKEAKERIRQINDGNITPPPKSMMQLLL